MAQQQVLPRSPPLNRRQSKLNTDAAEKAASPAIEPKKKRCGEMAGGAAAECAAVCCCCPFTVMELLYLTLYKVPCGLCRKMWRKSKARRKKKKQRKVKKRGSRQQAEVTIAGPESKDEATGVINGGGGGGGIETTEAIDVEEEEKLWDRFYGTGFWRSPSQRES